MYVIIFIFHIQGGLVDTQYLPCYTMFPCIILFMYFLFYISYVVIFIVDFTGWSLLNV